MGYDFHDTVLIARVQNIMRTAHGLKEATAASNPLSHSPAHSHVFVDTIHLPSPQPLLPLLHEAGVSSEVAFATSQIYQRYAEQLKKRIEESTATACRRAAEFPPSTSTLSSDLLMKRVTSIFTEVYFRRLKEWREQSIQRVKQDSKMPAKVASRNSRLFNHEYVPLLEHFFEGNPFPTHADKMFLAKKSDMEYKQIHVWFQNRRNRTKKEGKPLRKKSTNEGAMKPSDRLYRSMKSLMVDPGPQLPKSTKADLSEGITEGNVLKDTFASSSPPHAFPSLYPPTCHYDPFPCKSGPVQFSKPGWKRVPDGKHPLPLSTSIDDLVERFSHLNVRDGTRSKRSPKLHSHAATVAITVIPSRAPHLSLIACEYPRPTNIVQLRPSVRAPVSCFNVFQSHNSTPTSITLVPPSIPPNKNELPGKRKIARLPQRFPGRMRNSCRGITPSEGSLMSSSSPRLFSSDSENLSCSFSSVSSLSSPSDTASVRELPHLFRSSCRSPFDSPIHLRGLGDMTEISPPSVS